MADVLIAGGGPAGSALAIQLGRMGLSVELFERGVFPKEKPCGEGLMPAGVAALGRLQLDGSIKGAPFCGIRYHFEGRFVEGRFPRSSLLPPAGLGCRRRDLDHALFTAAANNSGVTAHMGAPVEAAEIENGRIIGLIVQGELRRGRLVVAADGARSRIRHVLGLDVPSPRKRVGMRAHFRSAPGLPRPEWVDIYVRRGYELYVTPLEQGELLVAALTDAEALRGGAEERFQRWCRDETELARRLRGAAQVTELQVVSPLSGRARRRFMPGLVLLGDAAGFSDPITGGGMTQALLSAELLAQCAAAGLDSADRWVEEFDGKREAYLRDYRRLTAALLWLADHPALTRGVFEVLSRSPALFSHLLGVSSNMRHWWGGEMPTGIRPRRKNALPLRTSGKGGL